MSDSAESIDRDDLDECWCCGGLHDTFGSTLCPDCVDAGCGRFSEECESDHKPALADGGQADGHGQATLQAKHVYEACWRQPEDVDRWLRQQCEGRVLNLCAGESPLGDVQVDADPARDPDVLADMNNLPFADASFDTVVFDPPWKIGYYKRMTPFFEAVRVTKPDGLILMNALWIGESENTVIDGEPVVRADDEWANISVIVPHRKQPGQSTLSEVTAVAE